MSKHGNQKPKGKQKELFSNSSIIVADEDWSDKETTGGTVLDWSGNKAGVQSHGGNSGGQRCYHSHPPYKLPNGMVIYGGSCTSPAVKDADIYIGFDWGMRMDERVTPWGDGPQCFYLPIQDMQAPADEKKFRQYVEWVAGQLSAGKKVHCGCIGGHGRTGMFLAALCKTVSPETEDAITHVRENYCQKAVENEKQVSWLHEHFGIKKVTGSKAGKSYSPQKGTFYQGSSGKSSPGFYQGSSKGSRKIQAMTSGCLWK